MRIVKPIVASKVLVKRARKNGRVIERRQSPKRGTLFDLFDETDLFHRASFRIRGCAIDLVLVDIEEWRYPGHGRRRRYRANDFQVEDQKLCRVLDIQTHHRADDLRRLIDCSLTSPFDTGELAAALGIPRWIAQRIAYCFREMGAARQVGKRRNAWLYEFVEPASPALQVVDETGVSAAKKPANDDRKRKRRSA